MKLLGSHIITSPLLSCLKTTSICSHFWRRWQWIWEQGMNWCNFAEVRKFGEGNQEGFDDFWRDRSSWASVWVFDDFLSVTQVKLLLDCASLLSGSRYCLSERLYYVCLNLQEYRRYLDEYNVYSVLTVQTNFTQPLTRHLLTELDPVSRLMLLFLVKLLV